jgi:hypothetical protein
MINRRYVQIKTVALDLLRNDQDCGGYLADRMPKIKGKSEQLKEAVAYAVQLAINQVRGETPPLLFFNQQNYDRMVAEIVSEIVKLKRRKEVQEDVTHNP